jgi:serine protease
LKGKEGVNLRKKLILLIVILIGMGIILSACDISSDNDFDLNGNTKITGQVITSNRPEYIESAPSSMSNKNSIISLRVNSRSPKYIEDEIVVKYERTAQMSSMNNSVSVSGSNINKEIKTNSGNLVKIKIPKNKTVEEMIKYFEQQPGVSYAEPNYIAYAQAVPNDSYYEEYKNGAIGQWGLWAINMNSAWDDQKSSSSVKVAVVDSGIIPDHPDFDTNDLTDDGANFVGEESNSDPSGYIGDDQITDNTPQDNGGSHGTHVTGIIGALTNNSSGVAGVSWNVKIMPVRVLDSSQRGSTFDIAEGIYYAADSGADIINLSLGSFEAPEHLEEAVKYADEEGSVLIAASGNYENSNEDSVFYPAAYKEVIAVGAVDINNKRADYSTSGSELDLVAPGGNSNYGILSTWGYDGEAKDGYNYMSGT